MKRYGVAVSAVFVWSFNLPAQVVTPAKPIVQAGQSLRFSADRHVVWSLLPGSAGTIAADGTYHAPASIPVSKSLGGCPVGAPDNIYNTRIDTLPLAPNNAVMMASLPQQGITFDPSWGVNIANNLTPSQPMVFAYTPAYNVQPFQIPVWPFLKRESGYFSDPLTDVDRHILTINNQTCQTYDIYNNYPAGTAGATLPVSTYTAQSGWQYNSMSYDLPSSGSTDAAGMALAPTTLNLDDIRSGTIRHALRVTFGNAYIAQSFVWPATGNSYAAHGIVPFGTRFRLNAGFDISGYTPTAQIILTALKNYGMLISDGGSNWDIITSTDATEDRTVVSALSEIANLAYILNAGQFGIVDESSLMVNSQSAQVKYGNGHVTPPMFAILKADDGTDAPVTLPIALQGIALNSPEGGGIWIQSGVTRPLSIYAGNIANAAVTWAIDPPLGSLDSASGVFIPPSVSAPTTASVTATSIADPTASVTFPVTVMPAGPIRISAGEATTNNHAPNGQAPDYGPDSHGNIWWRDQAVERGWNVRNDYWYGEPWPLLPDIFLYETQRYSVGDTFYRFLLPNGNYQVDYYVAQGSCDGSGTLDPQGVRLHLESQGQIAIHDFRPLAVVSGQCYTPIHAILPAEVTDNSFYLSLRHITDHTQTGGNQTPTTIIGAFSITPDYSSPHLSIDPAMPPPLSAAQTLQLYAVGWYMDHSVTWRLLSGPGTVDSSGMYTAPAIPVSATAVVQAVSTTDSTRIASLSISLIPGTIVVAATTGIMNRSAVNQVSAAISSLAYSNVTWAINPAVGTITSSGVYTSPDYLLTNTNVIVTATSTDDPALSGSTSITVLSQVPDIRVNCGDGNNSFTDANGNLWATDYGYSTATHSYNINYYESGITIVGATPDLQQLYKSTRYRYSNENFQYDFPIPNGLYQVTLKFADYAFTTSGIYNFDVQLNGRTVLHDFDPDAVFPGIPHHAVDKIFYVNVTGKDLLIAFLGHEGGAFVNGIQISSSIPPFSLSLAGKASLSGVVR